MSRTEKKDKQTDKGMRTRGRRGWGDRAKKVLTSSGSTPKSLQSFSTPSGPMVSGSSWPLSNEKKLKIQPYQPYCIIAQLLNFRASF